MDAARTDASLVSPPRMIFTGLERAYSLQRPATARRSSSRVATTISPTSSLLSRAISVLARTGIPARGSISLFSPPIRLELPAAATMAPQRGRWDRFPFPRNFSIHFMTTHSSSSSAQGMLTVLPISHLDCTLKLRGLQEKQGDCPPRPQDSFQERKRSRQKFRLLLFYDIAPTCLSGI